MRFGESVGRFQQPLDLSRRHRRCAVCGGGTYSWVLTLEGRSICTACYQDVRLRAMVLESDNGGDPPFPKGVSAALATGW
jgi:hypothetical protein